VVCLVVHSQPSSILPIVQLAARSSNAALYIYEPLGSSGQGNTDE
jgi:hypothetical protein